MPQDSFEFQIEQVLKEHPGLSYDCQSRMFFGTLVIDKGDQYNIIVNINPFPQNFPIVFETNERIRPITDNHINSDGSCCFSVPVKEQLLLKKGLIKSIPQFIEKIVIPFFQNNSYKEINGRYKEGEYSHGVNGIIEAYCDILGTKDQMLTMRILINFLKGKGFGKNDPCYCGSKKKIKNCHLYKLNRLKFIDSELIRSDLIRVFGRR